MIILNLKGCLSSITSYNDITMHHTYFKHLYFMTYHFPCPFQESAVLDPLKIKLYIRY